MRVPARDEGFVQTVSSPHACVCPFGTGKGVFCERLPGVDRQTAEACFGEADRCGRPLVCGFYK